MEINKYKKIRLATAIVAMLLVFFVTFFASLFFTEVRSKVNDFLAKSAFANVLNLHDQEPDIVAEAANRGVFDFELNAQRWLRSSEIEVGKGKTWTYDYYYVKFPADYLALARMGLLKVEAYMEIRHGYLFGSSGSGRLILHTGNVTASSGSTVTQLVDSGQFNTATNRSGSKYASKTVSANIGAATNFTGLVYEARHYASNGSAAHYMYRAWIKISVRTAETTKTATLNGTTSLAGVNAVNGSLNGSGFTVNANHGIREIWLERKRPTDSAWSSVTNTIFNANGTGPATTANTATSQTINIPSTAVPYGTKYRIRWQSNSRSAAATSGEIAFIATFSVSVDGSGLSSADYGITTSSSGTSTAKEASWSFGAGSSDSNLYVVINNLPSNGYYLEKISSTEYYHKPVSASVLLSNDGVFTARGSGCQYIITTGARDAARTYTKRLLSIKIKTHTISATATNGSNYYTGVTTGAGYYFGSIESSVTVTGLVAGFNSSIAASSTAARYMVDVGKWGYIVNIKTTGGVLVGKYTVADNTSAALEILRKDITGALAIELSAISRSYTATNVANVNSESSWSIKFGTGANLIHASDGITLNTPSAVFTTVDAGTNLTVTYTFVLNSSISGRGANYSLKRSATLNSGTTPSFTGSATTLSNGGNTITITATNGNYIDEYRLTGTPIVVTVPNKVYNGTVAASISSLTINNNLTAGGSDLALAANAYDQSLASAAFVDVNVGSNKVVNITGLKFNFVNANKAKNYKIGNKLITDSGHTTTANANITVASLKLEIDEVESVGLNKTYDGNDSIGSGNLKYKFVSGFGPVAVDVGHIDINNDRFESRYEDKNVGNSKKVIVITTNYNPGNINHALTADSGYSRNNYSIISVELERAGLGKITPKEITAAMTTTDKKVFDWTTNTQGVYKTTGTTSLTNFNLIIQIIGLVPSDSGITYADSVIANAKFLSSNVGMQTISTAFSLKGTGIGNYTIKSGYTTLSYSAEILAKPLSHHTISFAYSQLSYEYNGEAHKPNVTVQDSQKPGDKVIGSGNLSGSTYLNAAAYDNNVYGNLIGSSKAKVTVSAKHSNYATGSAAAIVKEFDITKADLAISAQNITLTYGDQLAHSNIVGSASHKNYPNYSDSTYPISGSWTFVSSITTIPVVSDSGGKTVKFTMSSSLTPLFNSPNNISITLTVNKRPIKIVARNQTEIYGNYLLNFLKAYDTFDATGSEVTLKYANGIVTNSNLNAELKSSANQVVDLGYNAAEVGDYDILFNDVAFAATGNKNYYVSAFEKGVYTITPRNIIIVPYIGDVKVDVNGVQLRDGNNQLIPYSGTTKVYGDNDPEFLYTAELANSQENSYTAKAVHSRIVNGNEVLLFGSIGRIEGENKGVYNYSGGSVNNVEDHPGNYNYNITFERRSRTFSITERVITIKVPNNVVQVYGDAETIPNTYEIVSGFVSGGGLPFGDTLRGSFMRIELIDVGNPNAQATTRRDASEYAIVNNDYNNLNNPNYIITQVISATYNITRRPVVIIPESQYYDANLSRYVYKDQVFYGDSVPAISSYTLEYIGDSSKEALAYNDIIIGNLDRPTDAKSVGDFTIKGNTIIGNYKDNYDLKMIDAVNPALKVWFRVNKRPVFVQPVKVSIDWGDNPVPEHLLAFEVPSNIVAGDAIIGTLTYERVNGQIPVDFGEYDILVDLNALYLANPNYDIEYSGAKKFVINKLVANIEVFADTIAYGDSVPTLYYKAWTEGGREINANELYGSLEVEYVGSYILPGSYEILQGNLSNDVGGVNPNPNFEIRFNRKYAAAAGGGIAIPAAYLTVTRKNIVIYPDSDQFKFFDGLDEAGDSSYSYTLQNSLVGNDVLSGNLTRASGSSVGLYDYLLGTLSHEHDYYNLNLILTSKYQIKARPILVTPNSGLYHVYGNREDALTGKYEVTVRAPLTGGDTALIDGYPLYGNLERVDATNKNAGSYRILRGNLGITSTEYDVKISDEPVYYTIQKRTLEITANSISSPFGEIEETISYRITQGLIVAGDKLNVTLAREKASENEVFGEVGPYNIIAPSLSDDSLNPNYQISFIGAMYEITPREIRVVPRSNIRKEYKDSDPVLTYNVNSDYPTSYSVVEGFPLYGSLTRASGENVGTYEISQGTLSNAGGLNANYSISFQEGVRFSIDKKQVQISVPAVGSENDTLYLIYNGKNQSIAHSNNTENEVVNVLKIDGAVASSVKNSGTYSIVITAATTGNYVGASFAFSVAVAKYELPKVEANDLGYNIRSKIYGDVDPSAFTVQKAGLENDGNIAVTFNRTAGENVGEYHFINSSITLSNNNYKVSISTVEATAPYFEIVVRDIIITPTTQFTKIYGQPDVDLSENIETGFFNDVLEVVYLRDLDKQDIGKYRITGFEWLNENDNYNVILPTNLPLSNGFTITARTVYVVADDKESVYGSPAVALTYSVNAAGNDTGLVNGDSLIGEVSVNLLNANAGKYAILQGTLSNSLAGVNPNPNYTIVFTEGTYTIKRFAITVTPDAKVVDYGDMPVALTYTISSSLIGDDQLEGVLYVENLVQVGVYTIQAGTLNNDSNPNYDITIASNVTYTIKIRSLVILPIAKEIVYGDVNYVIGYEIVDGTSLLPGDVLIGSLAHTGDFDNVGHYKITLGNLEENTNYQITLKDNNIEFDFVVVPRPITIEAKNIEVSYGESEKALAYVLKEGELVKPNDLSGVLKRESGHTVGVYNISVNVLNPNYEITFANNNGAENALATYTITKANITIQIDDVERKYGLPIALDNNKFEIIEGQTFYNDKLSDLNVRLDVDLEGGGIGQYDITGTADSNNYNVSFEIGKYIISKWEIEIVTSKKEIKKNFDGYSVSVEAEIKTEAENVVNENGIQFYIDGQITPNDFVEPGIYIVVLKVEESSYFYSAEDVEVVITISKWDTQISVASDRIYKRYDGQSVSIDASIDSEADSSVYNDAELEYYLSNNKVINSFVEPGEYVVVLKTNETRYFNSSEEVEVTVVIDKWMTNINVAETTISKKYDGKAVYVSAQVSSEAPSSVSGVPSVEIYHNGVRVNNSFVDPGKYQLVIKGNATNYFYEPDEVTLSLTILRDKLETEDSGIDVVYSVEGGVDPDYEVDFKKNDKVEAKVVSALQNNQKLVRSYKVTIFDTVTKEVVADSAGSLRIKVPTAIAEQDVVKIILFKDNGGYVYEDVRVSNGYITVDAANVSDIAFIEETSSDLIWIILGGVAALLAVVLGIVFLLKKRH